MNESLPVVSQKPISTNPLVSFSSETLTISPDSVTQLNLTFNMALNSDEFADISPQPNAGFIFSILEIPEEDNESYTSVITPFNVFIDRLNRLHVRDVPAGTVFNVCAKSVWVTPSDHEMPENANLAICTVTVSD